MKKYNCINKPNRNIRFYFFAKKEVKMEKGKEQYYKRESVKRIMENVIKKINEVNKKEEFIYYIKKAIIFGSYIELKEDKIEGLNVALYFELKNNNVSEIEQNYNRAILSGKNMIYILKLVYGKEEIAKFIKDKKQAVKIYNGDEIEDIDNIEHITIFERVS